MGNVRLQEVEYMTVASIAGSIDEYDNIYNEVPKENVIFSDPIVVQAYVHHMPVESKSDIYGTKFNRSILVLVHKDYETENGLYIELGQ
jgi:hypothetical protein